MKKIDKQKQQLLMHLSVLPIASGKQLECFFTEYQYPEKRVSMCLRELEVEGLVEGKARPIGESKVWRLSKKGREWMDVKKPPVPLSERKVEHYLAIASVYLHLQFSPLLQFFEVEPRFPFVSRANEEKVYAPDAIFIWKDEVYALEVQRSPLSSKGWAEKWKVAEGFYTTALPCVYEGRDMSRDTPIITLSEQTHSVIKQTELPLIIADGIEELFPIDVQKEKEAHLVQLIKEIEQDVSISRATYANWHNQKAKTTVPPFSIEALHKYEQLLTQLEKS